MDYSHPQRSEQSGQAFASLLRSFRDHSGNQFLWRVLFHWIACLFVIFVLFAYRPAYTLGPFTNIAKDAQQFSSAFMTLREYFARMAGTIPPECALSEREMDLPVPNETHNPGRAMTVVWTDKLLRNATDATSPCSWRDHAHSLIAFISFDVGPVQKITLLFLVLGLLLLRKQRLGMMIDGAAFPEAPDWAIDDNQPPDAAAEPQGDDDTPPGQREHQAAANAFEHPIRKAYPDPDNPIKPLYPVTSLKLDTLRAANSQTNVYRGRVAETRERLVTERLTAPFDLIIDVIDTGAATGTVGASDERMRGAVFEYRERLIERIWPVDYILWLLPTIGFLGTIYGISASLVRAKGVFQAEGRLDTEINNVVDGLGVAFDTTSMALIAAAILFIYLRMTEAQIGRTAERAKRALANLLIARMEDR